MDKLKVDCGDKGRASIEAISHYAVEAAILKVVGSEMLDFVADELCRYMEEWATSAEMARRKSYRDSRITESLKEQTN